MSTECLSSPMSIESIASQHPLPIVIKPSLGFRGSSRPILLHSIIKINFAYGRALKVHRSKKSEYQFFKPIESEIVAIPLTYPGYFECLLSNSRESEDGIKPEKSIQPIVERMQVDSRPQTFYVASPLRVYTLEAKADQTQNRVWHQIEAHQLIYMEKVTYVEYTPTEHDNITPEDYDPSWWFCFSKHLLNRTEVVIKCILTTQQICYIPCSLTDEICLYPIGQRGSKNVYKFHTIENLLDQFPLPINIKLAQFSNCEAYKDFKGLVRLVGSHIKEFAVCASLSSTNVCLIPVKNPIKFVITSIPLTSPEIVKQLSRCDMLIQSFDKQIRRILISPYDTSTHRSRSKSQSTTNSKQSLNNEQDEQITITSKDDEPHRSRLSPEKRRPALRRLRAISTGGDNSASGKSFKRTLSNDSNSTYNSLVHPIQTKILLKQFSSPTPSSSSTSKTPHSSTPFTYDTGSNLINDMDLPNANGAILLDNHTELFSPMKISII